MIISVVIPTFNEIRNGYLKKSLLVLTQKENVEVIVVDNMSTDGTAQLAQEYQVKLYQDNLPSRAERLKYGVQKAKGDIILMHHPRSVLSIEALNELEQTSASWGAFKHEFDDSHPLLKFTSFYSNYIRGGRGIFYLDHCIFFKRELTSEVLKLKNVEIFEDTEISLILRSKSKAQLLKSIATTSAVRFKKNGIIKQILLNQKMKILYYLGCHHQEMNRNYEQNLGLNNDFDS